MIWGCHAWWDLVVGIPACKTNRIMKHLHNTRGGPHTRRSLHGNAFLLKNLFYQVNHAWPATKISLLWGMLHARMWPYMSLSNKRHFWIKIRTNYLLIYSKEKLSPYKFKDSKILLPSQQKSVNFFFHKSFWKKSRQFILPHFLSWKIFL